jgi:preprotein translocase subunit SecD
VYEGNTTIKSAKETQYLDTWPAVFITLADGAGFHKFTSAHLNQSMGIYLDGKLLYAPRIVQPLDSEIYIVGGDLSAQRACWIAGVLAGGPLPAPVRLLREYRGASTQTSF